VVTLSDHSVWKSVLRKNAIPLGVLCYLLVVYVASDIVDHFYSDAWAVFVSTWVAALPAVIVFLMRWLGARG
jgi:hypothetical protein